MKNEKNSCSRRRLLQGAAAGAIALPRWFGEELVSAHGTAASQSPNDRPGILLIGCGGMGTADAMLAKAFGNVVAVCDVDQNRVAEKAEKFKAEAHYTDFRKAIDHKGVDVVINATPDHWHTLVNLRAIRSGKDVYSEKPLTLTIKEGRTLVEVARTHKRVLQTGSQQRSNSPQFRLACELVQNGRLGKLQQIVTQLPSGPIDGPFAPQAVPPQLDWDFWLGQAPKTDYMPQRCHTFFRFWYDYSGGTMTDWGAHHNDIAQWGNGTERSGPVTVEGRILTEPKPGGYTTPGKYEVEYTYANGVRLTCKSVPRENFYGAPTGETVRTDEERNGVRFIGETGWIFVNREKIVASAPDLLTAELPSGATRLPASTGPKGNEHMANFFDCVRSRQATICEPEIGHRSVSVCHLGVIALRTGRKLNWNPEREEFTDDREANSFLSREMRRPWSLEGV